MDYSAQCINIVSTNPDCVFLAVEGDYMGTCVKQLRQYGFEGTIISREELSIPQNAGTVIVSFTSAPNNVEVVAGVLFGRMTAEGVWPVAKRVD